MDRFGVVFVWLEERFRKKIRQRCTALDSIALLPIYHLNTKQALLFGLLILLQQRYHFLEMKRNLVKPQLGLEILQQYKLLYPYRYVENSLKINYVPRQWSNLAKSQKKCFPFQVFMAFVPVFLPQSMINFTTQEQICYESKRYCFPFVIILICCLFMLHGAIVIVNGTKLCSRSIIRCKRINNQISNV